MAVCIIVSIMHGHTKINFLPMFRYELSVQNIGTNYRYEFCTNYRYNLSVRTIGTTYRYELSARLLVQTIGTNYRHDLSVQTIGPSGRGQAVKEGCPETSVRICPFTLHRISKNSRSQNLNCLPIQK